MARTRKPAQSGRRGAGNQIRQSFKYCLLSGAALCGVALTAMADPTCMEAGTSATADCPPPATYSQIIKELEAQRTLIEAQDAQLIEQRDLITRQAALLRQMESKLNSQAADIADNQYVSAFNASQLAAMAPPGTGNPTLPADSWYNRAWRHPNLSGGQLHLAQDYEQQAPPPPVVPRALRPTEPEEAEGENEDGERPKSEKQVDQLLLDQGGVLLPPGKLQIEPSIEYSAISSDRVNVSGFTIFNAIVVGTIRVDDLRRDIITGAITARYGLFRRTQIELRVPGVYREDQEFTGIGTGEIMEQSFDGFGIGDASLTLSWQPIANRGWRPATIFRFTAQAPTGTSAFEIDRVPVSEDSPETVLVESPTGSGFYNASVGATMVWPLDPVVLFAGGGFTYAFEREFGGFGSIKPGNGFDWNFGFNLSLNDRVSTNFSFLNTQRFETEQNGISLLGTATNDARLGVGSSISLTDRVSVVLSAQAGLTDESPDFNFGIRVPITLGRRR